MQQTPGTSNTTLWWNIIKIVGALLVFVVFPMLKQLKIKADQKAKERRQNNLQREVELDAIRTGRGLQQVSTQPMETSFPSSAPMNDDPKARRERQLAELRRRAAMKSQGAVSMAPPAQVSQQPVARPGNSNSPVPILNRSPQVQPPRPMPVQRPTQRPVQKPQKMNAEQARQLAQRQAAQRQAVPVRKQVTPVSDVPDTSETHRLVEDSDVAKVTARQKRRGPVMGKAGIRQAMIMTEILGRPRSERLDEI